MMSRTTSAKVCASRLVVPAKGLAAARARLRLVAVGDGRRDEGADRLGDPLGDPGRQHDVDAERQMRSVLLGGAERQDHGRVRRGLRLELRPGQFGHEDAVDHGLPSVHCRAAVDGDALPGDEACARPGEKDDRRGDLLGPRDPPERVGGLEVAQLGPEMLEVEQRRVGRAGRHRVDQDVRGELARPGARQAEDARPWWRSRRRSRRGRDRRARRRC